MGAMAAILFTCPITLMPANGWLADGAAPGADSFVQVECPACGGVHLVKPDGRILGGSGDRRPAGQPSD